MPSNTLSWFTGLSLALILSFNFLACNNGTDPDNPDDTTSCSLPTLSDTSTVTGYGILEKLPGIWSGPVTSPTPIGSFPEWIVDFRPIAPGMVSAKNELDTLNDIFMSFFIVKIDCEYKMAFRNGGGFSGFVRNSYQVIDSVYESPTESYYRFAGIVKGENRVNAEIRFVGDSLIMKVFTNQFNALAEPSNHMHWTASLKDETSTANAISLFSFPGKVLIKDFSTTFDGAPEAIYYDTALDPFPESDQPYLGEATVNINFAAPASSDPSKKVLIIITTQPLFSGFIFNIDNLKYRSRYVFVSAGNSPSYAFNYMHPGNYYINAVYDANGDFNFSSGDFMNSSFDVPFTLTEKGTVSKNVTINFEIP